MRLSRSFMLAEFTSSQTAKRLGLDNTPSAEHIANLQALAVNVLQPIRDQWNLPVVISSGYRAPAVNRAVGGSSTSQHSNGQAADIEIFGVDNCALARWIADNLVFDQLILEFHNHEVGPNDGWVHVSYSTAGNKRQVLTAVRENGRVRYLPGLR